MNDLINHLLRIINTQNPIRHRFCTKCVRIIHLRSMFKRKNPSLNKQYLHSSHQICVEKYYLLFRTEIETLKTKIKSLEDENEELKTSGGGISGGCSAQVGCFFSYFTSFFMILFCK